MLVGVLGGILLRCHSMHGLPTHTLLGDMHRVLMKFVLVQGLVVGDRIVLVIDYIVQLGSAYR